MLPSPNNYRFIDSNNFFCICCSYLYTILADNGIASIPVLIVCNKQDGEAKGEAVVKALLEKEM